ncbi:hypothetical protein ACFFGH_06440 [Lysobacter korlensis]|uniref:Uncharacterized protein n=1 Tax=Lysobacter korlensis TaxID=553636 RepID=A0ABV6RM77_9GAMM
MNVRLEARLLARGVIDSVERTTPHDARPRRLTRADRALAALGWAAVAMIAALVLVAAR